MKISNLAEKSFFNFKRVSVSLNFSNRISTAKNTFEIKKVKQNFLKYFFKLGEMYSFCGGYFFK